VSFADLGFEAMGTRIRLLIWDGPGVPPAREAAEEARRFLVEFEAALTRFDPRSELCALNADPRDCVPASPLLRRAVRAGVAAAERSGGLVDPTLLGELEAAGYAESRAGLEAEPLGAALTAAPPRRPAAPDPVARWRAFEVDDEAGTIRRPPGIRFDTGGSGKGLAADMVAARLGAFPRFMVDCGGDIRVGGTAAAADPIRAYVEHPLSGERAFVIRVAAGGVATSGLNARIWRRPGGGFAHHLIDPATGEPAWTGLIAATALAATALEAETLAKAALLSGPEGRRVLAERGGLIVHDGGRVEPIGRLGGRPRIVRPKGAAPRPVAA